MTKEKIRSNIKFNDKKEERHASFYFEMKGIHFYKEVMIYLNHDFNSGDKLEWSLVSDTVKYDKKIRNRIYKYLATIEEYIRAYISNKYENDKYQDFWLNDNRNKLDKYIKTDNLSVLKSLEKTSLGVLIQQVNKLPNEDKEQMFDNTDNLDINLDALRVLRNKVSHHMFLLGVELNNAIVDGKEDNTLIHNIENLRQLLPKNFRYGINGEGGITKDINLCRCSYVRNHEGEIKSVPLKIRKEDVLILKRTDTDK